MAKSTKNPPEGSPRRASYQDVLDAPEHLVAEIVDGALHTHPRPTLLHSYAHTSLVAGLRHHFGRGGGNGAGGWLILLWFVDPEEQMLEVFELREGHWTLLETATGEAEVSPPPFSAAPFKLGDLWWPATPESSEPSSVHEPAAAAQSPAAV